MKVWVIMGNDFPNAVCPTEAAADAYVEQKKHEADSEYERQHGRPRRKWEPPRIYWRSYEFEMGEPSQ